MSENDVEMWSKNIIFIQILKNIQYLSENNVFTPHLNETVQYFILSALVGQYNIFAFYSVTLFVESFKSVH